MTAAVNRAVALVIVRRRIKGPLTLMASSAVYAAAAPTSRSSQLWQRAGQSKPRKLRRKRVGSSQDRLSGLASQKQ